MMNLHEFLGSSGANLPIDFIATTAHLEPNTAYGVSTKNGSVTVTLPMDSMAGDRIAIFDSDLTWSESKLVDVKWSYLVEGSLVNEVMSLTKKGGSIELVYLGESRGWVDARYYLSDTHPTWQWGWLKDESDKVYHYMEGGELSLGPETAITSSKAFTVPEDGIYLIVYGGGTGSSNTGAQYDGGDTKVSLNNELIATSFGSAGGREQRRSPMHVSCFTVRRMTPSLSVINGSDVFKYPIRDTMASLEAANKCGYKGDRSIANSYGSTNGGAVKVMDSFLIQLKSEDVVKGEIGAAGTGGSDGNPGKISVFKVNIREQS